MWVIFAFGSTLFAGLTSVLAKRGIKKTDSDTATAIRTIIVLAFSWIMVGIAGSFRDIVSISCRTWLFLILSGVATGASWLCYFRTLQLGDVNKVVPIDKSSTVLTILLALVFLGEQISCLKGITVVLIGIGTFMMIKNKRGFEHTNSSLKHHIFIYFVLVPTGTNTLASSSLILVESILTSTP